MTTKQEEQDAVGRAVKLGDELVVKSIRGAYLVEVVKAGPVWLTLRLIKVLSTDRSWLPTAPWKLRRYGRRSDSADPDKLYAYSPYWMTVAEYERDERERKARLTVLEHGIVVRPGSLWWDGRMEELARRLTMDLPIEPSGDAA